MSSLLVIFSIIGAAPIYSVIGRLSASQSPLNFTPFDFIARILLFNTAFPPVLFVFKVRREMGELYEWLESLIADSIVKT